MRCVREVEEEGVGNKTKLFAWCRKVCVLLRLRMGKGPFRPIPALHVPFTQSLYPASFPLVSRLPFTSTSFPSCRIPFISLANNESDIDETGVPATLAKNTAEILH